MMSRFDAYRKSKGQTIRSQEETHPWARRPPGVSEVSPIDVTTERPIAHLRRHLAIPQIPPGQEPSKQ